MRAILLFACLLFSIAGFAQTYHFKPQWKEGEVKHISITQTEKEFENDAMISEEVISNEARITVLKDNAEDYTLEVLFENQALQAAIEFYDKLGEELEDYKDLKLIYSINKETAEAELLNWEEAQQFMTDSFEQITKILEKKAPDMAPFVGLVFMPLEEMFSSKENIEAYMDSNIGYILAPFNRDFPLGQSLEEVETDQNPFNPNQEVSVTTRLTLESIDEASKNCVIRQEIEFDLSEFIAMIKTMMQQMGEAAGADEESITSKSNEMDEFELDVVNNQSIEFNTETTWVTKVVSTGIVSGTEPGTNVLSKREVISTTLVK